MKHFRLSPSGTERWLNCPGSLKSQVSDDRGSSYASEGTMAHDLAEKCLRGGLKSAKDGLSGGEPEDMAPAVQEYLDEIEATRATKTVLEENTELTVAHSSIEGLGGTPDHYMLYVENEEVVLHVFDYKHGAGVLVNAEENNQILSYFTILADKYLWLPTIFRGTVVQPRAGCDTIDTWTTNQERVSQHQEKINEAQNADYLCAGSWCRWCPALATCEEVRNQTLRIAREEFDTSEVDRLLELMKLAPAVKALLDSVPKALMNQFRLGKAVPGYKVIERLSNRKWRDPEKVEEELLQLGICAEDLMEQRLVTPTQLEKKLDDKSSIKHLIVREPLGHAVVPETARGKPVNITDFPAL